MKIIHESAFGKYQVLLRNGKIINVQGYGTVQAIKVHGINPEDIDLILTEKDKVIKCNCGNNFVHTEKDQAFFAKNNYTEPKRCQTCRKEKKEFEKKFLIQERAAINNEVVQ